MPIPDAHTPHTRPQRIFQLEIQKDQVVFQFGTFCHWTLEDGSEAIDEILDGLRKKKKLYEDPNGFEHFKGLHLEEVSPKLSSRHGLRQRG